MAPTSDLQTLLTCASASKHVFACTPDIAQGGTPTASYYGCQGTAIFDTMVTLIINDIIDRISNSFDRFEFES